MSSTSSDDNEKNDTFKRRFSDYGASSRSSFGLGTGVELLMGMRRSSLTNAALKAATTSTSHQPFSSKPISSDSVQHSVGDEDDKQAQEFADAITEIQQYNLSSNHLRASLRQSFVNPQRRRRSSALHGNDSASAVSSSHASGSVITGKRRSRVDMASAVAEVMQFYNDLHADSDEEDRTIDCARPVAETLLDNPDDGQFQSESLAQQFEDPELQDDRPTKRHVGSVNTTFSCTNTSSGQDRASSFNSSTIQLPERRKSFSVYLDNLGHRDMNTKHDSFMKQEPLLQGSIDTDESFSLRKQSLRDSLILSSMAIPRLSASSTLTMSTAVAALAASEVAESNFRRLSRQYETIPSSRHEENSRKDHLNKQRKMSRRVEFSISNIALEASMATAARMELLMKDRLASRANRANVSRHDDSNRMQPTNRPEDELLESSSSTSEKPHTVGRRRSLSFTSNVNVANTFAVAVSEDAHQNPVVCSINELQNNRSRNYPIRRPRRIFSIPDVHLLDRLSHATLEEGIDLGFTQDDEVDFQARESQIVQGVPVNHITVPEALPYEGNRNHNSSLQTSEINNNPSFSDYDSISDDDLQGDFSTNDVYPDLQGNSVFDETIYFPSNHQETSFPEGYAHPADSGDLNNSRIVGSSMFTQVALSNCANNNAAECKNDDEVYNHGDLGAADINEDEDNSFSSFDGKVSHVLAWYPKTDKEINISLVIFRAAMADDKIIKNLIQNYKNLTRLCLDSSNGENGGEIALHVGKFLFLFYVSTFAHLY